MLHTHFAHCATEFVPTNLIFKITQLMYKQLKWYAFQLSTVSFEATETEFYLEIDLWVTVISSP